ncbi:uncharacterized protein LOC133307195 [Gastrolobium bilobum]|uniref:uncharacterized protein LOC133307195 n=1 Tax=Gastrolobium bilobum TaxID=150636 RepID=UPI002AB1A025|nr:uncharacterized protein LOC133307195 [Gastrolobium bilobum]
MGYQEVIHEIESMEVQKVILGGCIESHPCFALVFRIKKMIEKNWKVDIAHIHREGNKVANWLACQASRMIGTLFGMDLLLIAAKTCLWGLNKKRKVQVEYQDSNPYDEHQVLPVDEVLENPSRKAPSTSQKGKNINPLGSYFMPRTTPGAQPGIKRVLQSKEVMEKCDIAISKWMIDAGVPFNAVNSSYYQPMIDAICSMGPGYKCPNFYRVRGHLLNKWVGEVKKLVESYRTIYCKLFRDVVLDVGSENVVQVVTDTAANYVAVGRLLEAEFPTIFWSPCAAHCINLMLQDFGKLEEESFVVSHAAKITKYIYNHCHPLHLMRKYTGGREILRLAPTRFATNFIALQSILAQKNALRAMLTEPFIRVLRIVDSEDKPAMGFLYQAIFKAKEEMIRRFQRNKKKVEPYLTNLDSCWDSQLRKNLHASNYWLNPGCRFNNEEFEKHKFTTSGLLDVIERYAYGNPDLNSKLTSEMRIFKNAELDFGRPSPKRERNTVIPDQWWESYGCGAPNLQKLAIRILSQTCNASGCERNWSTFEHIHSNKRNRLEHQKLNDLVYVRYNLRLAQRSQLKHQNYDPINFETFEEHSNWVLEESPPYLTVEEMEALRTELAHMSIQPTLDEADQLNLDDDDEDEAQDNIMESANQTEGNEEGEHELIDTTLPPRA